MTLTTLITGNTALLREEAIAALLRPKLRSACILEGLPQQKTPLESLASSLPVRITRIAPGCPCCIGNLTMRVTLDRILRQSPEALYISLASDTHLEQLKSFLTQPPYRSLITLTKDLHVTFR